MRAAAPTVAAAALDRLPIELAVEDVKGERAGGEITERLRGDRIILNCLRSRRGRRGFQQFRQHRARPARPQKQITDLTQCANRRDCLASVRQINGGANTLLVIDCTMARVFFTLWCNSVVFRRYRVSRRQSRRAQEASAEWRSRVQV
jgi:hypothetical protein